MRGTLVQLNVSPGGMPKLPVASAMVTADGVEGDWQTNRKYHGGPDRAICLFSVELYDALRAEGVDMQWGSVGENFTTRGITLADLSTGDRLRVGSCTIELTDVRDPCRKLDQWDKRLKKMVLGRSGWLARVIESGEVKPGDAIERLITPALAG